MTGRRMILILSVSTALGALALAASWARDVPKVATGFIASVLCSETFVSGLDPERSLSETTAAMPGAGLLTRAMDYRVDRARKDVVVTLLGSGRSHAVYREGLGCHLEHADTAVALAPPPFDAHSQPALLPELAGPALIAPENPQLVAALDRAFAELPFRRTKAIVVVRDGRIVAERYADGYGVDRHAITVDQLLRHTAGLALGSSLSASLGAALEPVNRMKFMVSDMAAYAEGIALETKPGEAWNYHDGNTLILSHLIRNATGGTPADVLRFADAELFGPLGMRHVTIEFDGAGTPEGSSQMLASARDWARFGLLYLNDGVAGGKRILPEGWVRYSASPTLNAFVGYGAGFWTNLGDSFGAKYRIENGWPRDAFLAKGSIGQYVIIIPSQHLVIVRLGRTVNWPFSADGVSQLVSDVVAATGGKAHLAGGN